ncbi:hypothetical protein J2741_001427 [Methanolinea mesophila]|uniref:PEGA domain-containing protein n=1 Tax=Methanolinea mesophila TaxID=547055 RepID=UPI001AE56FAC|nr:PEGA domain-containing protein [Methanolinea mesophila]MBP1928880.1 hypothetical protein [Methanolinea mesophila]
MNHTTPLILAAGLLLIIGLCVLPVQAISVTTGGAVGYFMITSDPPGGTIYFDGVDQGAAPVTVWVYTTGPPVHTVVVEKDGYQTLVQQITRNPSRDQTVEVNAVLVPGITYGVLRVESDIPGVRVTLDGNETMPVPAVFSPVVTGYHTVSSLVPGYLPYSGKVLVTETGTTTLQVNFTPATETGTLRVTSIPAGADLSINDVSLGKTPFTSAGIAAGMYDLRISHPGYVEWTGTATVAENQVETVNAELAPLVTFPITPGTSPTTGATTETLPATPAPTTRAGGSQVIVPGALGAISVMLLIRNRIRPRK